MPRVTWVERVKGGQSTHQPLTGNEVRMIRAYLRDRKFDTPWLFVGKRGDQLSRHAVQYIERQAVALSFRTMQDYMGHKNPRRAALKQ